MKFVILVAQIKTWLAKTVFRNVERTKIGSMENVLAKTDISIIEESAQSAPNTPAIETETVNVLQGTR